jgi:hypothetical protein
MVHVQKMVDVMPLGRDFNTIMSKAYFRSAKRWVEDAWAILDAPLYDSLVSPIK